MSSYNELIRLRNILRSRGMIREAKRINALIKTANAVDNRNKFINEVGVNYEQEKQIFSEACIEFANKVILDVGASTSAALVKDITAKRIAFSALKNLPAAARSASFAEFATGLFSLGIGEAILAVFLAGSVGFGSYYATNSVIKSLFTYNPKDFYNVVTYRAAMAAGLRESGYQDFTNQPNVIDQAAALGNSALTYVSDSAKDTFLNIESEIKSSGFTGLTPENSGKLSDHLKTIELMLSSVTEDTVSVFSNQYEIVKVYLNLCESGIINRESFKQFVAEDIKSIEGQINGMFEGARGVGQEGSKSYETSKEDLTLEPLPGVIEALMQDAEFMSSMSQQPLS